MVKQNECGSSESIGIVFEKDGSVLFAEYDIAQAQEDKFVEFKLESADSSSHVKTDELSIGDVIPIEVAKKICDRIGTDDSISDLTFIVPDHTVHFFTNEFPDSVVCRQTDHPAYQNALKNTTDYTLPHNWGLMDSDERSFWLHQERTYRQSMKQDTVWGRRAKEYHSDSEFKVDDGDLE